MKPSAPTRVTLSEVAAQAETSVATVSYVLNQTGTVSPQTRERVLSAVRDLGYQGRRRSTAKAPRGGLDTVTLLWINTSQNWKQSHLCHLMIETASTAVQAVAGNLRSIFYNEQDGQPLPQLDNSQALLLCGSPSRAFAESLPTDIPRLNVLCNSYKTRSSFIDIDNIHIGYNLTQHLIGLGHRHIGFASNNRHHRSFNLRYLGYLKALDEAGLKPNPKSILRLENPSANEPVETSQPAEAIEPWLTRMLGNKARPSAIVAANDWIAAAIYQYALRNNLRVPQDISIVGSDNDPSICSLLRPALTTHSVPYVEIGKEAVRWISALIAGNPPHEFPSTLLLRGKLVEGESCARV